MCHCIKSGFRVLGVYNFGRGEEVVKQSLLREKVPLYTLAKFRGVVGDCPFTPPASAGPAIIVKSWQDATFSHARMEYIQQSFTLRNFRQIKPSLSKYFQDFWAIFAT